MIIPMYSSGISNIPLSFFGTLTKLAAITGVWYTDWFDPLETLETE